MGDVKMLAMIGAFLGWQLALFTLFSRHVLGVAVGVPLTRIKRDRFYQIPLGTFLAIGALIGRVRRRSDRHLVRRTVTGERPGPCVPRPDCARRGTRGASWRSRRCDSPPPRATPGVIFATRAAKPAILSAALQEAVTQLRAQERAMAARAEASERLSIEIVTSLTSGLLVVGLDGTPADPQPVGRRLLGVSDPVPFTSYTDLLHEAVPLADVVEECLETGQPIVRRAVQLRSRGRALHLGVTASPLLDEESKPAGAICLFTDLTAVAELEEQLRLKDTLARLGELTAGLAHEFRNGLATIHGYARLVAPRGSRRQESSVCRRHPRRNRRPRPHRHQLPHVREPRAVERGAG